VSPGGGSGSQSAGWARLNRLRHAATFSSTTVSVGNPDPEPDLIDVLSGLTQCPENKISTQIFSKKILFFRLKMMCLWASYKKKI
jgi:hypothetical protein